MRSRKIRTRAGHVSYLETGEDHARSVVFLHGIGGGAGLFARQVEALGPQMRILAWDMPGYGGSDPIERCSVDGYAEAFAAFLGALGIERPILVGHSLGGLIVQACLARGLGGARAAVLAQTAAAFGGRDPAWAEDFVRARLAPLDEGRTMRSLAAGMVAGMIGDGPDADGVALAERMIAETPEAAFRAGTLALVGFDRREDLARIGVPILLVAGTRDLNAPAATMARMAERIPGAELVTVEGCGHLVMLERPETFTELIRSFADRLEDPT